MPLQGSYVPDRGTVPFVNQAVEAWAKDRDLPPAHAYGSIVLNKYVGGLYPESVEMAARLGARCVWLPSHDNIHHHQVLGESGGIELLDEQDKPVEAPTARYSRSLRRTTWPSTPATQGQRIAL